MKISLQELDSLRPDTTVNKIVVLIDREHAVADVAQALGVSPGYVYGVLREHRPRRQRKKRTKTSEKRGKILGLAARGIKVARIAFLCEVSPAWVYRVLSE